MTKFNTTNQMVREFAKVLDGELPSEEARTAAYNAELVNRYLTGQYLTSFDKREARKLIAAQKS